MSKKRTFLRILIIGTVVSLLAAVVLWLHSYITTRLDIHENAQIVEVQIAFVAVDDGTTRERVDDYKGLLLERGYQEVTQRVYVTTIFPGWTETTTVFEDDLICLLKSRYHADSYICAKAVHDPKTNSETIHWIYKWRKPGGLPGDLSESDKSVLREVDELRQLWQAHK
jgi:hypothetical protein